MAEHTVDDSKLKIAKVEVQKVDVKSGEEEEETVFVHRAKLYLFIKEDVYGGEKRTNYWKERGLGDVKVQKHKVSGKHRLLMRQEKTLKICANHFIAPSTEVTSHQDTDKACVFTTNDYASGEVELNTYTLRFKSAEVCSNFMKAYKDAQAANRKLSGNADPPAAPASTEKAADSESVPALVGQLLTQIKNSDWLEKQASKEDKKKQVLDLPDELLATVKGETVPATEEDADLASLLTGLAALTTKDTAVDGTDKDAEKTQMPLEELEKLMNPLQAGLVKMLDEQSA